MVTASNASISTELAKMKENNALLVEQLAVRSIDGDSVSPRTKEELSELKTIVTGLRKSIDEVKNSCFESAISESTNLRDVIDVKLKQHEEQV